MEMSFFKGAFFALVGAVIATAVLVADVHVNGEISVLAGVAQYGAEEYSHEESAAAWSKRTHEVTAQEVEAAMSPAPIRQIVNEDGSCAGVIYEGDRPDGDCSGAEGLPEVAFYDFFTLNPERFPD